MLLRQNFFTSCEFSDGVFHLTDVNGQSWYTHRHRLDFYLRGLLARGSQLGRTYLLNEIEFSDGDVVIDCGANMGDLQLYFLANNLSVKYFGLSQIRETFIVRKKT